MADSGFPHRSDDEQTLPMGQVCSRFGVLLCWLRVVRSVTALKTLQIMSFPPPETIPIFLLQLET